MSPQDDKPQDEAPQVKEPAAKASAAEEPAVKASAAEEPAVKASAAEEPAADASSTEEPADQASAAEDPERLPIAPASEDAADSSADAQRPSDAGEAEPQRRRRKAKDAAPWQPVPILGGKAAYGFAFLTGFLYFLSFPGIDIWPLSFIALAPLIIALRGQSVRRATGLGWVAGFTMTMFGFYWLLDMLKVFSGFPVPLCALFMALLCGYQAGRIALCGLLYGLTERRGWPASLAFVGAFAASELLYPLLFPWYFGATVHNAPVLLQTADLGGPILVGLVLVAPNLAVAEVVTALWRKRALDRRIVLAGALVPLVAALYGVWRISTVEAQAQASEAVKVGLVQGNSPLLSRQDALKTHLQLTAELKQQGVQLVVWSEAAVSGLFPEKDYEKLLRRLFTGKLGVPTIVGTVLHRPIEPQPAMGRRSRFFNVAVMADAQGHITSRYDKQFLLMFGEYLPFGETFPKLYEWSPNSGSFTPGSSYAPLTLGQHRYATSICYEDINPSFVNELVRQGDPDMLVNMTNDAWFGDTTEPWIHLALAKMRSVEHRRYLLRATNSGISAIVDPVGRVVAHSSPFKEETVVGTARYMRSHTVFGTLGHIPYWIVSVLMGVACFVRRPRRRAPSA